MEWETQWSPYKVETHIRITDFYSLFRRSCPEGYSFPGETHDFWECLYVLRGEVCVSGDDRVYQLSEGNVIFHKPQELHKFYVEHSGGADLLIFSFSMDSVHKVYFENKAFLLSENQKHILKELMFFVEDAEKRTTVPEEIILPKRYLYPSGTHPAYLQMVAAYVEQLLLSLLENASTMELFDSPESRLFSHAVNCMKDNLCTSLSVPELAKMCNVSVSGIKRIFDKYAGISVHKYFLKLKLQRAVELLMQGETVSETSLALGFSSQAYFTKAFQREMGSSPSAVKRV